MAGPGIEPDVEDVGLFAEFGVAAVGASDAGTGQFCSRAVIPDIGGVFGDQGDDTIEDLSIGERVLTILAIENDDWHAPDALTGDAPIGARGDHVGDALLAPRGLPLHFADGFERALPEIVALHANEPLFGGAEDGGVVAAPAVRITVLEVLLREQRAVGFQDSDDNRVRFPDGLAEDLFGQLAGSAFGTKKAALTVDRAVGLDSVFPAALKILLSMTGRGVDCAGALFERDVIGEDADGIAV